MPNNKLAMLWIISPVQFQCQWSTNNDSHCSTLFKLIHTYSMYYYHGNHMLTGVAGLEKHGCHGNTIAQLAKVGSYNTSVNNQLELFGTNRTWVQSNTHWQREQDILLHSTCMYTACACAHPYAAGNNVHTNTNSGYKAVLPVPVKYHGWPGDETRHSCPLKWNCR